MSQPADYLAGVAVVCRKTALFPAIASMANLMISAAEYRAKAAAALAQADLATTATTRDLYVITAREWTALSITAALHEKWERELP